MSKARTLADFISDGSEFADGTISVAEVSGAAPIESPTFTNGGDNRLTVAGHGITVDGSITLGTSHNLGDTFPEDDLLVQTGTGKKLLLDGNTGIRLRYGGAQKAFIGSDGISLADNDKVKFGYADNLQIYYDGTDNKLVGDVVQTGKLTTDATDLSALAATIADTAVDIFVYDTRKDSDGGAWRKRTQHTSWYNETLNTATRGSRKEFPAVAVIVGDNSGTNKLTIYDGDDPDLPMWMVVNATSEASPYDDFWRDSRNVSAIAAMNGLVAFSTNNAGDQCGVKFLSFIDDIMYNRDDDSGYSNSYDFPNQGIAQRNNTDKKGVEVSINIVDDNVNDVAMTVLPNAPIDAATGLPVPTIAVATNGGVSVIKDDGTVISTVSDTGYKVHNIDLQANGNLFAVLSNSSHANYAVAWAENYTGISGLSWATYTNWNSIGGFYYASVYGSNLTYIGGNTGGTINDLSANAIGSFYGLTKTDKNPSDFDAGLVNFISSSYNTGWMNGDIKLATLSDTDDTDVTGSDLMGSTTLYATGRIFSTTYTDGSSTIGISTDPNQVDGYVGINLGGLTAGKTYVFSCVADQSYTPVVGYYNFIEGVSSGSFHDIANLQGTTKEMFASFVAGSGTNRIYVYSGYNGTLTYTCSLRLAEEDRSVNGNGLQVFGTVTKNPVATGADLVAYSGFSTSNYLIQPYNSDLDFGTGDFCYMGWVKTTTSTAKDVWVQRTDGGTYWGTNATVIMQHTSGEFLVQAGGAWGVTSGAGINDGNWHYVTVVRRNGLVHAYWDANLKFTFTGASAQANGDDVLWFGVGVYSGGFTDTHEGSLALWRISATAPSPEQIKKIYEDEKVLFQENAQATLYGSSDAVTALAYDDSTELLHVGTSAGRSVFQGLRRVDNTTTAVGAAISASNGLVADE